MKVVVTGSRNFGDREVVERALSTLPKGSIVVHGGCPTGADSIADTVARNLGLTVRVYKADWNLHGRKAGPFRNRFMVHAENVDGEPVDACLAFSSDSAPTRGTADCLRVVRAEGIPVSMFFERQVSP